MNFERYLVIFRIPVYIPMKINLLSVWPTLRIG